MSIINIYHGDSLKAMESMPDKKYGIAICDPEYGIGADLGTGTSNKGVVKQYNKKWDDSIPSDQYFEEVIRITNDQIIWGVNYFNNLQGGRVVWDKDNTGHFSDCELAYQSFTIGIKKYKYRWNGMLQQDMKNKEIRIHPTQKPVALYKWLLKNYAKPGDKIFDSHGGSMSHAIACIEMDFDLDIYELDKDYYNSAVKRIKQHVSQLNAFNPVPEINYITL
ncbi:site-specific DNA-methyltransferase [Candidatus Pacearchaeota archaeon]|nr:site-specific DNA-methyltransferase [Candidatus Pacearchaeota archaeon]